MLHIIWFKYHTNRSVKIVLLVMLGKLVIFVKLVEQVLLDKLVKLDPNPTNKTCPTNTTKT